MGILEKLKSAIEETPRNKEILEIARRKKIAVVHKGRGPIDSYELKVSRVEIFGNGETEEIQATSVLFGFGDDYITVFNGSQYRDIPGYLLKDVEV